MKYQSKSLFSIMLLFCCITNTYGTTGANDNSQDKKPLTIAENIAVGSVTGIAEVTVNQPLVTIKNTIQQGKKLSLSPAQLYRGYGANVASMAPITAIQVAVNGVLRNHLSQGGTRELSTSDKMTAAFVAGTLSAAVSSPSELVVLHQQNYGKDMYSTVKEILASKGVKGMYRGVIPTACRDGGFTTGYLALSDVAKAQVASKVDNELLASLSGGIAAGLVASVVTHPFDTTKTYMQAKNVGMQDAAKSIYAKDGWSGFFKGLIPRSTRVGLAVALMSYVSTKLSNVISK
jgi:predicted Zn-ribbon and HTH transcriptional regulator